MDIAEQAKLFEKKRYYVRERRPFEDGKPDTSSLKPEVRHEICGGRDWVDDIQSVFGSFYAGGWVFGLIESDCFRCTSQTFEAYESNMLDTLGFRSGGMTKPFNAKQVWDDGKSRRKKELPKTKHNKVSVKRASYKKLDVLPTFEELRPIDQLAVRHDRVLRLRDERVWADPRYRTSDQYHEESWTAHRALRQGLQAVDFESDIRSWRASRTELDDRLWQEMGSLIYYEKCLAEFAIWVLQFVDQPRSKPIRRLSPPHERVQINHARAGRFGAPDSEMEDSPRQETQELREQRKKFSDIRRRAKLDFEFA